MFWSRRNSTARSSDTRVPKVKVHTTWSGWQYVDAEELMRHPDVVADVKRLSEIMEPIIEEEQRRLRDRRRNRGRESSQP